jgi:hypothetical protein
MNFAWFYEENGQTVGPVSLEALVSYLAGREDWRRVLVWRDGLSDWTPALGVSELSHRLTRPPPLPKGNHQITSVPTAGQQTQTTKSSSLSVDAKTAEKAKKSSRILKTLGWIGLFIAAVLGQGIGRELFNEASKWNEAN